MNFDESSLFISDKKVEKFYKSFDKNNLIIFPKLKTEY